MSQLNFHRIVILGLAILFLYQWQCKGGKTKCPEYTENIRVIRDTVEIPVINETWVEKPVLVSTTVPGKTENVFSLMPEDWTDDTVSNRLEDCERKLRDWASVRTYRDTSQTELGTVTVYDTIQFNRLIRQRITSELTKVEYTVTEEKTLIEKKRGQVYIGVDGYGGTNDPLYGAGASVMWKTKGDKIYEVGPVIFKDQPVMLKAGVKFLISFRKK